MITQIENDLNFIPSSVIETPLDLVIVDPLDNRVIEASLGFMIETLLDNRVIEIPFVFVGENPLDNSVIEFPFVLVIDPSVLEPAPGTGTGSNPLGAMPNMFSDPELTNNSIVTTITTIPITQKIEAEDLQLSNYSIEDFFEIVTNDNSTTADALGISLPESSDLTGTASFLASDFNLSGTYDLEISYFDENDGEAQLQVLINDTVRGDLLLNENTSSGFPTEDTRREYEIEDLSIQLSDTITIRGNADGNEGARVDFITFSLDLSPFSSTIEIIPINQLSF